MNDLIIQQGVGAYRSLMEFGRPWHISYAAKFGMDYEAVPYALGRTYTTIEKFTLPLSYMSRSGRWLMMIDADAIIIGDEDWRKALADVDFAAVRNIWGEFNLGVFFIRDTQASIDFLMKCIDDLPGKIIACADQTCEQMLLNQNLFYSPLKRQALNRRWNDYYVAAGITEGRRQVKAWHDLQKPPEHKLEEMKRFMEDFKRGAA